MEARIPHILTETGRGLDLSFVGKSPEHDPRRVCSATAADRQSRVDFDRLAFSTTKPGLQTQ